MLVAKQCQKQANMEEMPVARLLEEMEHIIEKVEGNKNLVIHNPHTTIWTVANVLDLDLTQHQGKKAGLLVFTFFKYMHTNNEPAQASVLFEMDDANSYSNDDLWIVRIAVKLVF
jgi:type I restriction-modification system DNA methylase subunit